MPNRRMSSSREVLVLAVDARRQHRNLDVERIDILLARFVVDLDDSGVLGCVPSPIGLRSSTTPSAWMDSTKSMKASVPTTLTYSS
jgi:hypothetical protein